MKINNSASPAASPVAASEIQAAAILEFLTFTLGHEEYGIDIQRAPVVFSP